MTVRELLARVDSRELSEWMAFERLEGPLGGERVDFAAALVAMTVANANRGKGRRPFRLTDFLPKWNRTPQTVEEMIAAVRTANAALGGTEETRR